MKDLGLPTGEYKFAQVTMNQYVHVDGKVICNVVKRFEKETKAIGELIADAGNTAQKCGLLPSELLRQRDELKEELAEQKRLYFKLFDEEISCMYCEAKIRRGSAIILCKECAENTEV